MAGDWIPMRTDLWECPEVVRLLSAICPDSVRDPSKAVREKSKIIGALFRTWALFDTYTDDGILHGYTAEVLNASVGMDNWAENLQHIGWLAINEQSVVMPEFNVWLSSSAKARLKDAQRKRNERKEASEDCPKPVRKSADKNRTTGQDRTGEYSEQNRTEQNRGEGLAMCEADLPDLATMHVDPLDIGTKMADGSVFNCISDGLLSNPAAVCSWFRRQLASTDPVLPGNRAALVLALCAARAATLKKNANSKTAYFVTLVAGCAWNGVKRHRMEAIKQLQEVLP